MSKKNLTLIHLEFWCGYENTRSPNCKRIKEREALRRVRTRAEKGLAK